MIDTIRPKSAFEKPRTSSLIQKFKQYRAGVRFNVVCGVDGQTAVASGSICPSVSAEPAYGILEGEE